jgi:two-component system phosphate regulon sensor histidine kinase PhoR
MTPYSPILRKLLLSSLLLILAALGSADFFLTRYTAARELQHAQQGMEGQIRILAAALAGVEPAAVADWTARAGDQSRTRVTVIDRGGGVLADSQHDPSAMDNHSGRPEVRQALAGQLGKSVRHSDTLGVDLCYLAVPAALAGNRSVILRLAVPLGQVNIAISEVRGLILRASLVAAVFALLIAYFLSRAFSGRIRRIETFAAELVNADYSGTLEAESDDELGAVARSLRGMAEQFRGMLRRLAEEAARRKAILSSMVEGVLAVDSDLRVTFCNDSFGRAVRASLPLAERLPLVELVRDPSFLDLLKHVLATGEPKRSRLALVAASGRVFEVQAAPLEERPKPGAIAILHDVTELERLERIRTDFVANLSHELRTPLATIGGYAETLLDGVLEQPDCSRKFLQIIRASTVRLNEMAADLLALSELEAELDPRPVRVSVREVAQAAVRAVEAEAAACAVDVIPLEIEDVHVMGQRFRLEHALRNLLRNGIRFNQPGGDVRLEAVADDGRVRIRVSDTGRGISSRDLPRIFERFYCTDKARSRETGGAGLGLAIVKHVAESMNGTVTAESTLGKGSVFTMRLPAAL